MKKVLFFIESFSCGGAEKSLLNLLNNLDCSKLKVHIKVLRTGGDFEKFVPKHFKIEGVNVQLNIGSRIVFKILKFLDVKKKYHKAQLFWQSVKKDIPFLEEEYDIAVAWGQGFATYFIAERTNALKKFSWVNTDFERAGYNWRRDAPLYQKFNKVIAVSEFVKKSMQKFLKKECVISIRDIVDVDDILNKAEAPISIRFDSNKWNLVSVGRIEKAKKFQLTILATKILKEKKYPIHWYLVGEGSGRNYLESLVKEFKLEDNFTFLGFQENPYPYIKACDIYCQTSLFEGLGLTLVEAGILNKPVVTTNFPTAYSIVEHGKTGLICEMNAEAVASEIERIFKNKDLREFLVKNLSKQKSDQKEKIIKEVKALFES